MSAGKDEGGKGSSEGESAHAGTLAQHELRNRYSHERARANQKAVPLAAP